MSHSEQKPKWGLGTSPQRGPGAEPLAYFPRAQRRLAAAGALIYFDLSPLREAHWTGIPVVAAGFARALLDLLPDHVRFFEGRDLIDAGAVDDALRRNTGLYLDRDITRGYALAGKLPRFGEPGLTVGFFPSVKPLRRAFDIELNICHDLSTITFPLMHIRGNVVHHTEAILADLASDDLVVTVSEASRADLVAYLGVDPARIVAAPNGVAWPDWYESEAVNEAGAEAVADSVEAGVIPASKAEDLVFVFGVFIHPAAADDKKIYQFNYEATKMAIASAMAGKPTAGDMIAGKEKAVHPFRGF